MTENERAEQNARQTIDYYRNLTGSEEDYALLDFLADAMHLYGEDYVTDCLNEARKYYEPEKTFAAILAGPSDDME